MSLLDDNILDNTDINTILYRNFPKKEDIQSIGNGHIIYYYSWTDDYIPKFVKLKKGNSIYEIFSLIMYISKPASKTELNINKSQNVYNIDFMCNYKIISNGKGFKFHCNSPAPGTLSSDCYSVKMPSFDAVKEYAYGLFCQFKNIDFFISQVNKWDCRYCRY